MEIIREEWRPLNGKFEGWPYMVSNTGRVWTANYQRLKAVRPDHKGYLQTQLKYNKASHTALVHRLVLSAFNRPPRALEQVNHIDGVKTNNCIENLEWVTCRENHVHAVKLGLRERMGVGHFRRKLSPQQVREIRTLIGRVNDTEIGRMFGVAQGSVRLIRLGVTYQDVA
jgi:hypothetical protein